MTVRRTSWPSANASAQTSRSSPTDSLTGYRRQSSIGQTRWIWILARVFGRVVIECFRTASRPRLCTAWPHESSPVERDPAARDVPAGRQARPRGAPVRGLARGGGPDVVAGAAGRPSGHGRLAVHGLVRVRRLAGVARLTAGPGVAFRGERVPNAGGVLD